MAGDGGYPKAWRHYIESANFLNAGLHAENLTSDIANMRHQIEMDAAMIAVVTEAASFMRLFLVSLTMTNAEGDTSAKKIALSLIDQVEVALKDATGRSS